MPTSILSILPNSHFLPSTHQPPPPPSPNELRYNRIMHNSELSRFPKPPSTSTHVMVWSGTEGWVARPRPRKLTIAKRKRSPSPTRSINSSISAAAKAANAVFFGTSATSASGCSTPELSSGPESSSCSPSSGAGTPSSDDDEACVVTGARPVLLRKRKVTNEDVFAKRKRVKSVEPARPAGVGGAGKVKEVKETVKIPGLLNEAERKEQEREEEEKRSVLREEVYAMMKMKGKGRLRMPMDRGKKFGRR